MSKPVSALAYVLEVIVDPLQARERRDAMARTVLARMERGATGSETTGALRHGPEEAGTAAAEKLERLLSGSP